MAAATAAHPETSTPVPPTAEQPLRGEGPAERSYARSVLKAWLVGVPVIGGLMAAITLAVGDVSVGGAVAIGLFAGMWISPLAGVVGVGAWAARQGHR